MAVYTVCLYVQNALVNECEYTVWRTGALARKELPLTSFSFLLRFVLVSLP